MEDAVAQGKLWDKIGFAQNYFFLTSTDVHTMEIKNNSTPHLVQECMLIFE